MTRPTALLVRIILVVAILLAIVKAYSMKLTKLKLQNNLVHLNNKGQKNQAKFKMEYI